MSVASDCFPSESKSTQNRALRVSSFLVGLTCLSLLPCVTGDDYVELFGYNFSITNTTDIFLSGQGLSGTIPTQVGLLTNLMYWDLLENDLTGTIPSQVGKLTNLMYWDLSSNALSGTLPTSIGLMTSLEFCDLYLNEFTGTVPTQSGHLTQLVHWGLYYNQFTGTVPTEIGRLTSLTYFRFSFNFFTGTVPTQFGLLTRLTYWGLSQTRLTGTIPTQVGLLKNLTYWGLFENDLTGTIPSEVGGSSNLLSWLLFHNRLSGTIPTAIGLMTIMSSWDLSNNKFTGGIPTQIGQMTNMMDCFLSSNSLSGTLPSQLSMLTDLKRLDLASNKLTGSIPPNLSRNITHLTLHHNRLSGTIPRQFSALTQLQLLSLFDNRIGGSVPPLALPSTLLLLFNNLLSCPLPDRIADHSNHVHDRSPQTLVALGNQFPSDSWWGHVDAKAWLYKWDYDSKHLFEMYPRLWIRLLALVVCCVFILSVVQWVRLPRGTVEFTPPAWMRCRNVSIGFSAFAAVYMIILALTPHMHECPNSILVVTLTEARFSSHPLFSGVIACATLHLISCIAIAKWMRRESTRISPDPRAADGILVGIGRRVCVFTLWILTISVLHVPVFFYLLSESFPSNNSFRMDGVLLILLRGLVSPWLVLSSEWLIPKLSVWMTARYYHQHVAVLKVRLLRRSSGSPHVRTSIEMVLVSQLFSVVVAPMVSQILLHNRCKGLTNVFWGPCQDLDSFNVDVTTTVTLPGMDINLTVPVLDHSQVCSSQFDGELCQRAVIASIATLSVSKVVYQSLFVLLRTFVAVWLTTHTYRRNTRFAKLCHIVSKPREESVTRSIASLVLLGFALGGAVPLIWPAVLLAVHSSILLWWCSRQRGENRSLKLVGRRVVWLSVAIQLGLGTWFIVVNLWRE
eukprot:c15434_g1_i1.p1 GENE.c15434_g1_i1~~c15434_g1_i1.p1  ORF type:complete len:903 (+),score=163.92 c15434_g1_i1:51-2759(+)